MALYLEDKRKEIAIELHQTLHKQSTKPDEVTLNFAFTLMKQAVTEIAALRAALERERDERREEMGDRPGGAFSLSAIWRIEEVLNDS